MNAPLILHIAVPSPLFGEFDYLPPKGIAAEILMPGVRVSVPFGRGKRVGVLLRISPETDVPAGKLRRAEDVLDDTPLLVEADRSLLTWAATYYQHPLGEVMAHALPVSLRKGKTRAKPVREGYRITDEGRAGLAEMGGRAPRQRAVLELLAEHDAGISKSALRDALGDCASIVRTLLDKGWIKALEIAPRSAPSATETPRSLYPAQQQAFETVRDSLGSFTPFLLEGITGSGKTEVYLALTQAVLARGEQVLVLVPEIGLTPQLMNRFQRRFGEGLSLLHSGLAERERELAWHAAREGRASVVLGTRSAIFTPLPRLGLIVVDEEHDLSFKQQEGFRYSARDLAVVRASRAGCPLVLGSATPSLESLHNADSGRYRKLTLGERAGNATAPKLDLIDIRSAPLQSGLSATLIGLCRKTLAAGNQVMLFLNRRGYAPVLTCHDCGWLSDCPRCDARMTLHRDKNLLWCHHCGHQRRTPTVCPDCNGNRLAPVGVGTERLEDELKALFPEPAIVRVDRDSTRRKGELERRLADIKKGRYQILLGTQMLAKGHHFPDVTLVGMPDVDQGLFGADYRAAERMAQMIIQVAGRAGRADKPGHVLIQTRHPDHPLLQTLIHRGYSAFAEEALAERRATALPPFSHHALLRAEAASAAPPLAFLEQAMELLKANGESGIEYWGPVPAPMERRAGRVRAHLLLQSSDRARLQAALKRHVPTLDNLPGARKVRWSIDVDPQEMV